jgi:hypothetical protein
MPTDTLSREASSRAGWSFFMGLLTAAIGAVMIVYPLATATASTVFAGSALIVAAGAQFVFAFTSETAGNFFLKLVLGVLYAITGLALTFFPVAGLVTLTAWIGAMLIVEHRLRGLAAEQGSGGPGPGRRRPPVAQRYAHMAGFPRTFRTHRRAHPGPGRENPRRRVPDCRLRINLGDSRVAFPLP